MILPEIKKISETVELHVFDLVCLTPENLEQIDREIVQICEGDSGSSLELVKLNFLNFLKTKDYRTQIGAVAEFFIHLYLRQFNLKQEFLFFNLEEGSIKKGFDGFFSSGAEVYLVESKSGLDSTRGVSHKSKLKEAFDDISLVVSGESRKSKNNPWRNAYNHACHIDVGADRSIREKIKELSDMFDNNQFKSASEFNIIPCSSIFITDEWNQEISRSILEVEESFFTALEAKSLKAICLTKASLNSFLNYLEGK